MVFEVSTIVTLAEIGRLCRQHQNVPHSASAPARLSMSGLASFSNARTSCHVGSPVQSLLHT
jgi:hypothetical protein